MKKKDSKKVVRTFAGASFLNDMGADMINAIWPLFVTGVLGAPLTILGLIDGIGDSMVSISQAISGYFSDRLKKRKIFIWLGYTFGGLSRIGYAISTSWVHLIPFRILDRSGKMRDAPRDAIVADISTRKDRGKNFGILRAGDNLGAVVGIIITLILFGVLGFSFRSIFYLAAIPSIIAVLLIIKVVKERKTPTIKLYKGLALKQLSKDFNLFLLLSTVFSLGSFSYSFLLIFAKDFGFAIGFIPVLYLIFTAVASIISIPAGKLADAIGRKAVIALSYISWALVSLIFIFSDKGYVAIISSFVFYGLHKGLFEPSQKAFVSELAPTKFRASGLGGFQMVTGIVALPASLIAGILWDVKGILIPFYFSLFLTIIALILLAFVKENKSKV